MFENSKNPVILDPAPPVDGCLYPFKGTKGPLKLVIGGMVMVTNNLPKDQLANGLMARLVRVTREHLELHRCDNLKTVYLARQSFTDGKTFWQQFPVIMAEAITINKSQGMPFDGVIVVTESMYQSSCGAFYTAISRARSLKSSRITNVESVKWGGHLVLSRVFEREVQPTETRA